MEFFNLENKEFMATILGGFIAGITGLCMFFIQAWYENKKAEKLEKARTIDINSSIMCELNFFRVILGPIIKSDNFTFGTLVALMPSLSISYIKSIRNTLHDINDSEISDIIIYMNAFVDSCNSAILQYTEAGPEERIVIMESIQRTGLKVLELIDNLEVYWSKNH